MVRSAPWPVLSLLCLGFLASCATTAQVRSGVIEVDGGTQVLLQAPGGSARLTGPVGRELAALPGALVKVWGTGTPELIRARLYQVLDAGNGFAAYVGWITYDQFGVRLSEWRTGRVWTLSGVSGEDFRDLHGHKVWLTGLEEGPESIRPLDWGPLEGAR